MAVCTHNGCEALNWFRSDTYFIARVTPPHSQRAMARKLSTGPAPRSPAALPLGLADGKLVVAGPFTSQMSFEPA